MLAITLKTWHVEHVRTYLYKSFRIPAYRWSHVLLICRSAETVTDRAWLLEAVIVASATIDRLKGNALLSGVYKERRRESSVSKTHGEPQHLVSLS